MTQSREGAVSCWGTQATPHAPHGAGEVRPGDRAGRGWVPARFRRWPSAVLRPGWDSLASAGVVTHCDPGLERDPAPQSAHCTAGTVFALEGFGTFLARGTPGPLLPGGRLPILVLHLTGFAPPPSGTASLSLPSPASPALAHCVTWAAWRAARNRAGGCHTASAGHRSRGGRRAGPGLEALGLCSLATGGPRRKDILWEPWVWRCLGHSLGLLGSSSEVGWPCGHQPPTAGRSMRTLIRVRASPRGHTPLCTRKELSRNAAHPPTLAHVPAMWDLVLFLAPCRRSRSGAGIRRKLGVLPGTPSGLAGARAPSPPAPVQPPPGHHWPPLAPTLRRGQS